MASAVENDLIERGAGALNWITLDDKGRVVIDMEALRAALDEAAAALVERKDQLLAGFDRMPATIADADQNNKAADMVRLITACAKAADAEREAYKAPFWQAGGLVDTVFKQIIDPLIARSSGIKGKIETRMTSYQREVEAAERRRREEEAKKVREEEDRRRREAEEAARLAREAEERAESETDLEYAIRAGEEAKRAEEVARQAAADAVPVARAAEVKAADLTRERSDFGAVSSLRTFWDYRDFNRDAIDLDKLRPHLNEDDIKKALRAFIRAGGRSIDGATIFQNTVTQVR